MSLVASRDRTRRRTQVMRPIIIGLSAIVLANWALGGPSLAQAGQMSTGAMSAQENMSSGAMAAQGGMSSDVASHGAMSSGIMAHGAHMAMHTKKMTKHHHRMNTAMANHQP
jgi:hypothetical protein